MTYKFPPPYFVAEVAENRWGIYPIRELSRHETLEEASAEAIRLTSDCETWVEVFEKSGTENFLCIW